MAAFETEAKVYPGIAQADALLANILIGAGNPDLVEVRACSDHGICLPHYFYARKQSSFKRLAVPLAEGFGSAPAAVLDFAAKAAVDVIVMSVKRVDPMLAAHLPKLDTAYEVVSRAPCPVLTIR